MLYGTFQQALLLLQIIGLHIGIVENYTFTAKWPILAFLEKCQQMGVQIVVQT